MGVIETVGLTKQYPRVTALDSLDMSVGDGVTGLVGANGAGKSTLIKILLGLTPASIQKGKCNSSGIPHLYVGAAFLPRHGRDAEANFRQPGIRSRSPRSISRPRTREESFDSLLDVRRVNF